MMNRFYQKNRLVQWSIALILLGIALISTYYWLELIEIHKAYFLLFPFFVSIVQFSITPILTLIGVFQYLSPMLLVLSPSKKRYEIHNGTPFDYLMVMRPIKSGKPAETLMLIYYLEGLLKISTRIERGELPDTVKVVGTSYFFSDSTAQRFGFTIKRSSVFMAVNAAFNYMDLIWMLSYVKGKWAFPNLFNMKKAVIDGKTLLAHQSQIQNLHQHLSQKRQVPVA